MLQHCSHCGQYRYPASPICHACLSSEYEWVPASGTGTLFSFVIVHRGLDPYWQGEVPYVVAVVELLEGPRLLTNLSGIDFSSIEIGMALEVFFESLTREIVVPRFRAARVSNTGKPLTEDG